VSNPWSWQPGRAAAAGLNAGKGGLVLPADVLLSGFDLKLFDGSIFVTPACANLILVRAPRMLSAGSNLGKRLLFW